MTDSIKNQRQLIEGTPALIVIDILESSVIDNEPDDDLSIPHMADYGARMRLARKAVDEARAANIPVIFIQEVHRPNLIDFGRELDGAETIHCLENNPMTDVARAALGVLDDDYIIKKRRYSAFYGTDLEILLRGLKADTLLLCGGLTDVCVHYTFVDGHQGDYFCRVIEDCVAGSSQRAHDGALEAMEYLQTGARRSLAETVRAMKNYGNMP